MNNDLISREALKEAVNDLFRTGEYDCNSVLKAIDNAPPVVNEKLTSERTQGEWTQNETDRFYHTNNWKCSNCNSVYVIWNSPQNHNYNFCPNCGAETRGEAE